MCWQLILLDLLRLNRAVSEASSGKHFGKQISIRPPGTLVPKAFCFSRDVFLFFNQTQDLRAPSADRRETLHSDQKIRQLFNASPKIRGSSPKKFYPAKFSVDFTQLPTFIANISGRRQDIQNRKDTRPRVIPPAFSQTSPVNFGPVSTK